MEAKSNELTTGDQEAEQDVNPNACLRREINPI
jgi:hypothetical protein